MGNYIIRRLLYMLAVLLAVSLITFSLMHAVPGGPFDREKPLPEAIIENLNAAYHLDEPLWRQYARYVYDILIPRITAAGDSTSFQDDFLIRIDVGSVGFRWMNFG